jgi:hypothetical protein
MADIGTIQKMVNKPLRLMGARSTDVEGQVLYFEYGTFTIANGATTGELPTDLTNVVAAVFTPMNAYTQTALAYSDLVITSGAITVANADPGNAAGAIYAYLLIGTVETIT